MNLFRPQLLRQTRARQFMGPIFYFLAWFVEKTWGRQVVAVAYDAFGPLAESVLTEICHEAAAKWGKGLAFKLIHRTGKLTVGEISLAISVSSKHRDASYLASRFVIEELKVRAPIWKKEFYEDGESEWLKGHALCGHGHSRVEDHVIIPPSSSTTSS